MKDLIFWLAVFIVGLGLVFGLSNVSLQNAAFWLVTLVIAGGLALYFSRR